MIKKTNTRPAGGTAERAAETAACDRAAISYDYITTTAASRQRQVLVFPHLPKGEGNAIRAAELTRSLGLKTKRELQHAIAIEREAGALILSTCRGGGGYYRPSDGEAGKREISAFVSTLASRAINTLRALKAARRELKTVDGQITFDQIEAALMAVVNSHEDCDG